MLLLLCLLPGLALASVETRRVEIEHEGRVRGAILDADPDLRDAPLLVALHGGIGGASLVRRRAGGTLARRGWAVLWPEADGQWNDGRLDRWGRPFAETDDVGFLRALVGELIDAGMVDPDRVFFAGPSIGGMMTLRMLCDAPDLVAGAAIAIAAQPEGLDCGDGPARPTLFLHGDADPLVPPEGGRLGGNSLLVRDRGGLRSAAETVALLSARNGCEGYAEREIGRPPPGDETRALRRDYAGCAAPLVHIVVEGGGHTWPGSRPFSAQRLFVGETSQAISATREIERFFEGLAEN
jgi:polyhydroxybutyrate depolymerase